MKQNKYNKNSITFKIRCFSIKNFVYKYTLNKILRESQFSSQIQHLSSQLVKNLFLKKSPKLKKKSKYSCKSVFIINGYVDMLKRIPRRNNVTFYPVKVFFFQIGYIIFYSLNYSFVHFIFLH